MGLFGLALGVGMFMLLSGLGLGKLFDTNRKIKQRGFDRPMNLSFSDQWHLFFRNADITIPVMFGFFGVVLIFVAVVLAVFGAIQMILV